MQTRRAASSMDASTGNLLLWVLLAIRLISQVSSTKSVEENLDVRKYALHLGVSVRSLPRDAPLEDFIAKVASYMSRPEPFHKVTPDVLKCQELLLSLEKVARGEFCGADAETRSVLALCYNSLFYTENDTIAPFIIRAFDGHRDHCRSKNIENLKRAELDVPAEAMRDLLPIFEGFKSGQSWLSFEYSGRKIFEYDASGFYLYDVVIRAMSESAHDLEARKLLKESKELTIPEIKLIELYDRLVYQPCLSYYRIVEPAFTTFKQDEEFLRDADRSDEMTALLMRPVVCKTLTRRWTKIYFDGVKSEVKSLLGKSVVTSIGETLKRGASLQKLPAWYKRSVN